MSRAINHDVREADSLDVDSNSKEIETKPFGAPNENRSDVSGRGQGRPVVVEINVDGRHAELLPSNPAPPRPRAMPPLSTITFVHPAIDERIEAADEEQDDDDDDDDDPCDNDDDDARDDARDDEDYRVILEGDHHERRRHEHQVHQIEGQQNHGNAAEDERNKSFSPEWAKSFVILAAVIFAVVLLSIAVVAAIITFVIVSQKPISRDTPNPATTGQSGSQTPTPPPFPLIILATPATSEPTDGKTAAPSAKFMTFSPSPGRLSDFGVPQRQSDTFTPTSVPTTNPNTDYGPYVAEIKSAIQEMISPFLPSYNETAPSCWNTSNPMTPQQCALDWIVHQDLYLKSQNFTETVALNPKIHGRKIAERYALAMLYYMTQDYVSLDRKNDFCDGRSRPVTAETSTWSSESFPYFSFMDPSLDVCHWKGYERGSSAINCRSSPYVDSVWLAWLNFRGQLPDELVALQDLETMMMDYFGSTGTIPSVFPLLPQLRNILHYGSVRGSLPPNFFQGSTPWNLSILSFVDTALTGTIPEISKGRLGNLDKLRIGNTFRAPPTGITGTIPKSIENLIALRALWLDDNSITGTLPSELGKLANLMTINLENNKLGGSIPPELAGARQLRSIELKGNALTGPIPTTFQRLSRLEKLDLGGNVGLLSGEGVLPSELKKLRRLTKLTLYGIPALNTSRLEFLCQDRIQRLDIVVSCAVLRKSQQDTKEAPCSCCSCSAR